MGTEPAGNRAFMKPPPLPVPKRFPSILDQDPSGSHHGVRVRARGVGDPVQRHCERPRVQSR